MKKSYLLILGLCFIVVFNFCNSGGSSEGYYSQKVSIEIEERNNPLRFLSTDGTYRPTLFGNKKKVIEGSISNNATVVTYKNVTLEFYFYNKNEDKIGSGSQTLYQNFPPQKTINFKLKIDFPKGTKTIGWDIKSAERP